MEKTNVEKTNYVVVLEVRKLLPADDGGGIGVDDLGESLCLQKVYPVVNGKKDFSRMAYRFIRCQKNGQLKSQRGQAQAKDIRIFSQLMNEMMKKEMPTILQA